MKRRKSGRILPPVGSLFGIMLESMIGGGEQDSLAGTFVDEKGFRRKFSPAAMVMFSVLWYCRVKYAGDFPGLDELADLCHFESKNTAIKAIDELERGRFLNVVRSPGHPNDYQLLDGRGDGVEVTPAVAADRAADRSEKTDKVGPDYKAIVDWWFTAYSVRFKKVYAFNRARDGKAVKDFMDYYAKQGTTPFFAGVRGEGMFPTLVWGAWNNSKVMDDKFLGSQVTTIHGFWFVLNQLHRLGPGKIVGGKYDAATKVS